MNYPDTYDNLSQPSPTTIRSATGGISPAITVQELIKIVQLLEAKLGLNSYTTFTANSSTDTFTAVNHSLNNGDILLVKSEGSLPPELTTNTRYYVINKATNTFQLSATAGGAAINISSAGSGIHSFTVLIGTGKALVGAASGVAGYTSVMPAGAVIGDTDPQTLSNKTLITPTVASFVNATHNHQNNAGGGQLAVSALTSAAQQFLVPTGAVIPFAGLTAPSGFLLCYGQAVSRSDYATLFGVIGTTYGVGDGSTTFNLPDGRGRAVAGKDDMGDTSADRLTGQTGGVNGDVLGAAGGEERHVLTVDELASHDHRQFVTSNPGSGGPGIRQDYDADAAGLSSYDQGITTGLSGTNAPHNNVQPTLILNYVIKV